MITLNDCRAFCEADPAVVARVTQREQLPEILAIACAQSRLMKARLFHAPNPITLVPVACVPQRLAA
jgi:carbonic anhydrase